MCYAPVRRSMYSIQYASKLIEQKKFAEAERVINATKMNIGSASHNKINGRSIGSWLDEAQAKLKRAKSLSV